MYFFFFFSMASSLHSASAHKTYLSRVRSSSKAALIMAMCAKPTQLSRNGLNNANGKRSEEGVGIFRVAPISSLF
jgi:hypothetical protein